MTETPILRQDRDAIATLVLNMPGSLNALSVPMLRTMEAAFAALAEDRTIRAVILKGTGRVFSAGHDLKEMQAARAAPDGGAAWFKDLFDLCARVMQMIPALPQPVIAQVHGLAAAAGCQLAASCDLITATEDARFGVNGVNIGLFCSTPMVALTRKLPPAVAFEMLTTGEFLPAPRAHALGMVNRIAPQESLDETTLALAATLAGKLTAAVKIGKPAFYAQAGLPPSSAYALCGEAMVQNMLRPDTAEGIQAFIEKRKPDWG